MTDFRLVDKKGLKAIYGIPYSPQHIARLEKAGKFPRRIQLGACRVAWHCAAVETWIGSLGYSASIWVRAARQSG